MNLCLSFSDSKELNLCIGHYTTEGCFAHKEYLKLKNGSNFASEKGLYWQ